MALRMAQYGTGHGHAAGKARAMSLNPEVELVGIYEPDLARREQQSRSGAYPETRWFGALQEMLGEPSIDAIAIEGANFQGLAMAREAVAAGKHVWYDKPAGDDWASYLTFLDELRAADRYLQMGYMFRYHPGFRQIADWARSGLLGDVFSVRAHFSTSIPVDEPGTPAATSRKGISRHRGGIFYDLAGHMLDQIVWILGRPERVHTVLRNDATPEVPAFADNTLGVLEFSRAIATVEIAAMETRPMARRFEVYGSRGSAILLEPFEDPGGRIRLTLDTARDGHRAGAHEITFSPPERVELYERELEAFVDVLLRGKAPDRTREHERIVQETLLRGTGGVPGG